MGKTNLSIAAKPAWNFDTSDIFTLRLEGVRSTVVTLAVSRDNYEVGDGQADDEALALSIQYVHDELLQLERMSYDLDDASPVGSVGALSLKLMWARALTEILVAMFEADGFKVKLGNLPLCGHLHSIEHAIKASEQVVMDIHAARFPRPPTAA